MCFAGALVSPPLEHREMVLPDTLERLEPHIARFLSGRVRERAEHLSYLGRALPRNVDVGDNEHRSRRRRRTGTTRDAAVPPFIVGTYAQRREFLVELRRVWKPSVALPRRVVAPLLDDDEMPGAAVLLKHIDAGVAVVPASGIAVFHQQRYGFLVGGRRYFDVRDHGPGSLGRG